MTVNAPAPNPCASCPYRQDAPSGVWAAEEYDKLPQFDAEMPEQPAGLFLCHQNDRGSDKSQLCAGWVACHGPYELLGLRLAEVFGNMTPAELDKTMSYTTNVPVFSSGAEAAEHGKRDIDCPDEDAENAIEKIGKRRKDVRAG